MVGYGTDAGAGENAQQAGEDVILLKKYCLAYYLAEFYGD